MSTLVDTKGNDITYAGNPAYVERSHHNKMLGELATSLSLLEGVSQALFSAKKVLTQMVEAGVVDDKSGNLNQFQLKTGILIKNVEGFLSKYQKDGGEK